jgi:hypothetical protein
MPCWRFVEVVNLLLVVGWVVAGSSVPKRRLCELSIDSLDLSSLDYNSEFTPYIQTSKAASFHAKSARGLAHLAN